MNNINLSKQQSQIIKSNDKNVLVIAGAGSGKTRVLTEKIRYLVNDLKINPLEIVAITFTNMAADEMRERLEDISGIGDAFIGTIHSFANRIFSSSGSNYTIFNDDKNIEFHSYLISKYCHHLTHKKWLDHEDNKLKLDQGEITKDEYEEFLTYSERYELNGIESRRPSNEFPETLFTLMESKNVITFDQLLVKATEYFKSIGASIQYLLVDEFQDIGNLEYKFIKSLNAKHNFFVGDDWQSIYGFKGANIKIFKNLVRNNSFTKFYLTENYRNKKKIVELANLIISQVHNRIEKDIEIKSIEDEGEVIIGSRSLIEDWIKKIKENRTEYNKWFILTRDNKTLASILVLLDELGVPSSSFRKGDLTLSQMREEMNKNTVKVLTIHSAKGLENNNVILVGNFPVHEPNYRRSNPEERRVLYVGITRAKDKLILLN